MSTKFITKILSFVTSKFYCTDFPVPLYCRKWYYMLNANGLGLLVPHKHEIIQIFTAQVGLRAAAPIAGSKVKVCKIIPWWTAQSMLPDNIITWSTFVPWYAALYHYFMLRLQLVLQLPLASTKWRFVRRIQIEGCLFRSGNGFKYL